jgi:hypothetical protein
VLKLIRTRFKGNLFLCYPAPLLSLTNHKIATGQKFPNKEGRVEIVDVLLRIVIVHNNAPGRFAAHIACLHVLYKGR